MKVLRRFGVLAAAAAAALACTLPADAHASASYFDVVGVGSPASNVGALWIEMGASSPITGSSITADLYAAGSATPTLTVTGFTLTSGDNSGGTETTWTVSTPISQTSLPLGTYTVAVQAQDSGGDTLDDPDAGSLGFVVEPTLTLSASPATYSYGQSVTFSGTDEGLYPDGTTQPVNGQPVTLVADQLGPCGSCTPPPVQVATATTGSDGQFSLTAQAGIGAGSALAQGGYVTAAATATVAAAQSGLTGTVVQAPARISASVSPALTPHGAKATISGTVAVKEGSAWVPAGAGVGIGIDQTLSNPPSWACAACASTNASGHFSFTLTVTQPLKDLPLTISAVGESEPWNYFLWLGGEGTVSVRAGNLPVSVSVAAQKRVHGRVYAAGCARVSVNNADPARFPRITIEDAYAPTGPWQKVGSGQPSFVRKSGDTEACSGLTVSASRPFVRAVSAADAAYRAGASTGSRVLPTARSDVHVTGIGPRHVARGGRVELHATFQHGRLLSLDPPGPATVAQILFRARGSRTWKVIKTARITGNSVTAFVRLYRSGYLEVRYPGNLVTEPSESASYYIRVS